MQRKSQSDDGLLPPLQQAHSISVCLPCYFLRERKMPGFSGLAALDLHSTTRLAKLIFLLWKQKHWGLGITLSSLLEEFVRIFHCTVGWFCSFRLLGSLGPVYQRICEKSLQPIPGLPGVTHSKVVGTSSKSRM